MISRQAAKMAPSQPTQGSLRTARKGHFFGAQSPKKARTLRNFRKSGKVRRDIFNKIVFVYRLEVGAHGNAGGGTGNEETVNKDDSANLIRRRYQRVTQKLCWQGPPRFELGELNPWLKDGKFSSSGVETQCCVVSARLFAPRGAEAGDSR